MDRRPEAPSGALRRQLPGCVEPCIAMQVRPEQSGALGPRRRQLMFGKRKRSYAWEGGRGCPQLGKPRQRGPGCRELSGNMSQLRVCDSGRLLEEFSAGCRYKAVANWRETGRLGWVGRGDEHRPCGVNQRTAVGREVRTPREATERGNGQEEQLGMQAGGGWKCSWGPHCLTQWTEWAVVSFPEMGFLQGRRGHHH